MDHKVGELHGVGAKSAKKLEAVRIKTVGDLLGMCCDTEGRRRIAEQTGLAESKLLAWSHKADLIRVAGIGPEFSELLEAAGVLTVKELRHRVPAHLTATLAELNEEKKLIGTAPFEKEVTRWVENAKATEPNVCESGALFEDKNE